MSIYCISYVWQTAKEDSTSLLVLLALADYANDDGECWPGIPGLARKCRISERNAQLIIRKMERDRTISVAVKGGRAGNGGRTNRYRINGFTEWLCQVHQISPLNAKVVKSSAIGGEIQRSKVVNQDSPDPYTDNRQQNRQPSASDDAALIAEFETQLSNLERPTRKKVAVKHSDPWPYGSLPTTYGDLFVLVRDWTGVFADLAGKLTKALLAAYPDATPEEFKAFTAYWDTKGLTKPSGTTSLPKQLGIWKKEQQSARTPSASHESGIEIPPELLVGMPPGRCRHPEHADDPTISISFAQYRSYVLDRLQE